MFKRALKQSITFTEIFKYHFLGKAEEVVSGKLSKLPTERILKDYKGKVFYGACSW